MAPGYGARRTREAIRYTRNRGGIMATAAATIGGTERSEEKRVIFASSLGTVFEWYDF
jgi:hypothetical protein